MKAKTWPDRRTAAQLIGWPLGCWYFDTSGPTTERGFAAVAAELAVCGVVTASACGTA
jgi:hypothetical protein